MQPTTVFLENIASDKEDNTSFDFNPDDPSESVCVGLSQQTKQMEEDPTESIMDQIQDLKSSIGRRDDEIKERTEAMDEQAAAIKRLEKQLQLTKDENEALKQNAQHQLDLRSESNQKLQEATEMVATFATIKEEQDGFITGY